MEAVGTIDILNVAAGHLQFNFNKNDPIEKDRARRAIADMLKRGYSIFIDLEGDGKTLRRVKRFDPKRDCYIIADVPGDKFLEEMDEDTNGETKGETPLLTLKGKAKKKSGVRGGKKGSKERAIPARKTRATAVGPTAGG